MDFERLIFRKSLTTTYNLIMPNIRKGEHRPHVVIVDTNVLWHKDKKPAVNPDFAAAWTEASDLAPLELVVPETVRGEILFQQTTSAWKRFEAIGEDLSELSGITAHDHRIRLNRSTIKRHVAEKFDRWARSQRASIAATPFSAIAWPELAENSVWRESVFTPDAKNPDAEKGFRDALILNTLKAVATEERRSVNIVFVSDDTVLRRATEVALHGDPRFSAYENLAGFTSYLKLTKEKLNKEFIARILARAEEKFFAPDDPTSLFVKEKIPEKIKTEFEALFADPEGDRPRTGSWTAAEPGVWRASRPEFVSVDESDRIYHWKSPLVFTGLYRAVWGEPSVSLLNAAIQTSRRSRLVLQFDVLWKARVKADARFHDVAIETMNLVEKGFKELTDEERREYFLSS